MSVISTYRKKKEKKKLQKALFLMQMIDTWQQFQELQVYIPNTSEDQPTFSKSSVTACKMPCCFKSPL